MRIERVKINGFGSFNKGIDIDLGEDHLSLIIGRNEAGKSTIMSAVFGTLFGFKDSALQKKFQPWEAHDEYSAEVQILGTDGRRVRVKRQFIDNTAEISEEQDGDFVPVFLGSANPRGHTDEDIDYYRRLEQIVGFQDEAIFRGTVFVGQSALQTSITDQIRKLVSGSGATDFKGVLHDLHSQYSELTMENPWRKKSKARPRRIEKINGALDEHVKQLDEARENFVKTMTLEQEVKKLQQKLAENKSSLEDNRATLAHFERFCKLVKDRDAARERFGEANRRRETYLRYRDKVSEIDREVKSRLSSFNEVGDEFPELVTRLKSESRELDNEEALLDRDSQLLRDLQPAPNNKLGALLAVLGVAAGGAVFVLVNPAFGVLAAVLLGIGLFFLGRTLATGYEQRKAELEAQVDGRAESVATRRRTIERVVEDSRGLLGDGSPDEILEDYRRYRTLMDDRSQRISAMKVLGEWGEIEGTYEKTAEENLRCNGLMDIVLRDAPYLTEMADDQVAIARSMEELKRRIGELQEEIEVAQEVVTDAKIQLARATSDVDYDLPALEEAVVNERRQLKKLEMDRDALRVVIDTLEECVTEFQEGDLTQLSEEVSDLFRDITGNRYTRVTLSPNMEPMLTKFDNTHIHPDDLSQGTQDQLFFAMRVAIARHLSRNVALPLFLDDPFVNFDQERLDVTKEMLGKLEDHQIVMVTCDRDYQSWSEHILDLDMARAQAAAETGEGLRLRPSA